MKYLITNDFFWDFEVIEAPNIQDAESYIVDMLNRNEPNKSIKILGSSEDANSTFEEWKNKVDGILYVSDYEN